MGLGAGPADVPEHAGRIGLEAVDLRLGTGAESPEVGAVLVLRHATPEDAPEPLTTRTLTHRHDFDRDNPPPVRRSPQRARQARRSWD